MKFFPLKVLGGGSKHFLATECLGFFLCVPLPLAIFSLGCFISHNLAARYPTAAIAELHALLAKDPHDNEALYNLGWCQERRGSVLDAANAYTSCLNEAPRRLDARLNLAALHHKHGQ